MPCYRVKLPPERDGTPGGHAFICGKLGPHCADCAGVGDNLCNYPVGRGKTCDRAICDEHSHQIGPNMHYCETHFRMWKANAEKQGCLVFAPSTIVPLVKK